MRSIFLSKHIRNIKCVNSCPVNYTLSELIYEYLFYCVIFITLKYFFKKQSVWLCTKSGELCLGRSYKYYSLACALKQRMLNFVQNLLNYMTFEVFESSWNTFEENIRNVMYICIIQKVNI